MIPDDVEVGEIKHKITYDYLLELYEEIALKKDITDTEKENQFAVLKVLTDHIGEYMVIKDNKRKDTISE